jgi:transposase
MENNFFNSNTNSIFTSCQLVADPLYSASKSDLINIIDQLLEENKFLRKLVIAQANEIAILKEKIKELEGQLSKNSRNSNKAPSGDTNKKTKSQRGKSVRTTGGQPGRIGKALEQVEDPDHVIIHSPHICKKCNFNLSKVEGECSGEKRQVFEIPEPQVEVTEHRLEAKRCPCCGEISQGAFPENIKAPVQYGEHVQALATYFRNQHLIPIDRVCQIFEDVFNLTLSSGTSSKIDERLFKRLEPFEFALKVHLLSCKILGFDETGMRCEKKQHWIHVTSSDTATFYGIHTKRGQEAIDAFDILPKFLGVACHDYWKPYLAYTHCQHALCNAHHLRELTYIYENEKEEWAKEMKDLLIQAKKEVEAHESFGKLPEEIKQKIKAEYQKILNKGFEYHKGLPKLQKSKRGKQKQRPGKNLLDRFKEKQYCVLRFIEDFSVPFTNNSSEQDIRMLKVKQKVSGCFRSLEGGKTFCRIRSYISTARKQGWKIWNALVNAIRRSPRMPVFQFT